MTQEESERLEEKEAFAAQEESAAEEGSEALSAEVLAQLEIKTTKRIKYLERTNHALAEEAAKQNRENERLRKLVTKVRNRLREHMHKSHRIKNPKWGDV